ncbi:uncharacterized protein RJT20DRAFT_134169 [Scheffersomyces xylosifermentans]|uniref:uncharacterized protein n=1 Tax=Scheffersomyces xylosifermentans TaxID=1304137 RepID=UPI00315D2975
MVSAIDLKALNMFINTPVNQDMVHKIVVSTLQVIPCKDTKTSTYSVNSTEKPLPSLMTFLTRLVRYTNVYTGTLMATLVYLNRLKTKLPKNAQGLPCTRHRILLSCLILSSKFHNDSSPKNIHWAKYTDGLFSSKDINLMERQLLYLLNWDMKISNEEMCSALSSFLEPIKYDLIQSSKMRKFLSKQRREVEEMQQQYMSTDSASINSSPSSSRSSSVSPSGSTTALLSPMEMNTSRSPRSSVSSTSPTSYLTPGSIQPKSHYRQTSTSSISSVNSTSSLMNDAGSVYSYASTSPSKSVSMPRSSDTVDPIIEMTALKEEIELNKLLKSLNHNNSQPMCYAYNY